VLQAFAAGSATRPGTARRATICFAGEARYTRPLSESDARRFAGLRNLGDVFVLGFATGPWPRSFVQDARFYLLPNPSAPLVRYAAMALGAPVLLAWLLWRHDIDVIVAQSPYSGALAALVAAAARRLGRTPILVVEAHGDFEAVVLYRRVPFEALYRRALRATARFALRRADLLRGVSSSTSEQLRRLGGRQPLVQFLAWTDLDVFATAEAPESGRHRGDILFAGVIARVKGLHHLVRAFARLAADVDGIRLVIAGREADATYAAHIRAEVQAAGLTERVAFVGAVTQQRLAGLMAACRVFVLPSLSEGLPRAVVEAMATGAPVIASRVGGVPELIANDDTGWLVPAGDEDALGHRLRWVLANPEAAERVGARARAAVSARFSTQHWFDGYARILAAAAELREPRPAHQQQSR
jgi:glycosyltransferase involved in cell wall biosynthesis